MSTGHAVRSVVATPGHDRAAVRLATAPHCTPAASPGPSSTSRPRLTSAQAPPGTAILGDWRQARLVIRADARLAADPSGENVQKNLVQLRLEGRYGWAALRPAAFAIVELVDGE